MAVMTVMTVMAVMVIEYVIGSDSKASYDSTVNNCGSIYSKGRSDSNDSTGIIQNYRMCRT